MIYIISTIVSLGQQSVYHGDIASNDTKGKEGRTGYCTIHTP